MTGSQTAEPAAQRLARARDARERWCRDARLLGSIAYEADASRSPLRQDVGGHGRTMLAAAWERRAGLLDGAVTALGALPDWAEASRESRRELALLAGAMVRARPLRRSIDGVLLSLVAFEIGEARLDLITRLCAGRPALSSGPWSADPVADLLQLGGEVLLRTAECPDAVLERLAMLFPASEALAQADAADLRRVADDARMLWRAGPDAAPAFAGGER
ncbi:MAG: hypothetical protein NTV19_04675 [Burkholderiales bacterium]|nr:hypothetical protein [Burkholderiales bacterium]